MKAVIKDKKHEYKIDNMLIVKIDNGQMTITYYDEEGVEHQEFGAMPDYIWIESEGLELKTLVEAQKAEINTLKRLISKLKGDANEK
jgi:hypothetical protein